MDILVRFPFYYNLVILSEKTLKFREKICCIWEVGSMISIELQTWGMEELLFDRFLK